MTEIENSAAERGGGPFGDLIFLTFSEELSLETHAKAMAEKISARESTLVELIESLGSKLTSTNVQDRVKATDILAHVFSFFPKDFLSEKELVFIVEFLSNRLKDQHIVIPKTILCIHSIIQSNNLPKGAGSQLLHQIFQEANVQSHIHKIRRTVFLTIEYLLKKRLEELKELSSDFVINFLQAIDGEKDPRNLLLLFQIIPIVISNFNLGPFIEDFFEVLACYFPIDFSPTVTTSEGVITREMLAEALHACLSHTNQFSEFLIPLVMEKLDSSLNDAKIDSLLLLELCCERCYQPVNLLPFLSQIWHSLRREIFMSGNELIEKHSIRFLQKAFNVLSRDDGTLKTCMDMILTECNHHLCEPELRLINPTSKILFAMCNSSQISCQVVAPKVLKTLVEQLTQKSVHGERKRIMEITDRILAICRQYPEMVLIDIVDNWGDMIVTWFSFLTNDDQDFGCLSLQILLQCLRNESDFSAKDRELLQMHMSTMVNSMSLSQSSIVAITEICKILVSKHGSEFIESSLPELLKAISNTSAAESESENEKSIKGKEGVISAAILSECCLNNEDVCQKVVSHLLEEINHTSINIRSLQCLNRTIEKVSEIKDVGISLGFVTLLVEKLLVFQRIFDLGIHIFKSGNANGILDGEDERISTLNDPNVFRISVTILRNLMRSSNVELQCKLVGQFWKDVIADKKWNDCFTDFPFAVTEAILGSLWPPVEIHRRKDFTDYLLTKSVQMYSSESLNIYQRLIAVFLNKLEPESEFSGLLNCIEGSIDDAISEIKLSSSENLTKGIEQMDITPLKEGNGNTCNAIHLLAWVTKALAMRGVKELTHWVDKLINLLSLDSVGNLAADAFKILLSDDIISLNPQSHCKFRFLYKQRIFQMSVPKLVVGYRAAKSNSTKANFIGALSSQLKYIPKEILGLEVENVFPLLVASLKMDSHSTPVVLSTLKAFTEMMQNSDEETDKKLVEYCYEIVPQMVKLASFKDNMNVRIMALQCLQKCSKCPTHVILPFRQQIIDDLQKTLDDHKRLVRKEARLTRNIWILIGSPGGL